MRIWKPVFGVAAVVVGVTAAFVPMVAAHATGTPTPSVSSPGGSGNGQGITVRWADGQTKGYSCTTGSTTEGGYPVTFVDNLCPNRMWVHQDTNGGGASYCVNPGAQAYDQPATRNGTLEYNGNYFLQASYSTTNSSLPCDSGALTGVLWSDGSAPSFECFDTFTAIDPNVTPPVPGTGWVFELKNNCNVRIWLHEKNDGKSPPGGSGASYCISPGDWASLDGPSPDPGNYYDNFGSYPGEGTDYTQFQMSSNQAPCAAG